MQDQFFADNPTVCEECDWVNPLPGLFPGQKAKCRCCGHTLVSWPEKIADRLLAYGLSGILMLIMTFSFTFLGFSTHGTGRHTSLPQTVTTLISYDYLILGAILFVALFVIPLFYLLLIMYLAAGLRMRRLLPGSVLLSRWYPALQPWLMVDVFLVGVLVSMVKLRSMIDIQLGLSFWALCGYALLVDKTVSLVDRRWMWRQIGGLAPAPDGLRDAPARVQGVSGCQYCGAIVNGEHGLCRRCRNKVHTRNPGGLKRTLALLSAAAVMYVPANIFPIMSTVSMGKEHPSTLLGGVVELWRMGSYPVAIIIFSASVMIPLIKILSLLWLCKESRSPGRVPVLIKMRVYRVMELIGRWSMIDVFVVATLVGLVRMGNLMSVVPGPAAVSFAAVVVLTMLAAMAFDPRLLWDSAQLKREGSV
jgi:paraquat-inducible protein A